MMEIGSNLGWILALGLMLILFGVAYNQLVMWMQRNGYDEGYTAILVVIGNAVTLSVVAIVDWRAAALAAGAFTCSGLPMIIGGWWRHVRARRNGQEQLRDDATESLAERGG